MVPCLVSVLLEVVDGGISEAAQGPPGLPADSQLGLRGLVEARGAEDGANERGVDNQGEEDEARGPHDHLCDDHRVRLALPDPKGGHDSLEQHQGQGPAQPCEGCKELPPKVQA